MTPPLVEWYSNEVLCDLIEVGLQGQIHIGVASIILEEARKNTKWNSTLHVMEIIALKPP